MHPHRIQKYEQRSLYGGYLIRLINADMTVSEQCGIAASNGNPVLGLIMRNITYTEKQLIIP